ncbi:MAG TPA: VTT domain-containing protein [Clostridia bacterium]|nr:VTT domain-containing protein [Clostridia bacterium]
MDKTEKNKLLVKGGIILLLLAIAAFLLVKYYPDFIVIVKNREEFSEYLRSFGNTGKLVFVLLQVLQVIIAVVPGDVFHLAGGFVYGVITGFILSYIGIIIGSAIAFTLARVLGYDFIKHLVPEKKIRQVENTLNSVSGTIGIFIICLIPWIPKDVLVYAAGITPIKPSRFLTVFCIARIPGLMISTAFGNAFTSNVTAFIEPGIAIIALLVLGLVLKKKVVKSEHKKPEKSQQE